MLKIKNTQSTHITVVNPPKFHLKASWTIQLFEELQKRSHPTAITM
jgi:hypothetical protein